MQFRQQGSKCGCRSRMHIPLPFLPCYHIVWPIGHGVVIALSNGIFTNYITILVGSRTKSIILVSGLLVIDVS